MESVQTIEQRKRARVEEIRDGLARLCLELADYGRVHGGKFWIYGSAATGQFRFDSDIDILVDFAETQVAEALDFAETACVRLRLKPDAQPRAWCTAAFFERISAKALVLP
jgi:predicted nucleotidyltransferase